MPNNLTINWTALLSRATIQKRKNYVRSILEVIGVRDMIQLSGGLPDSSTFPPKEMLSEMLTKAYKEYGDLFQYEATPGFLPFRNVATDYLKTLGVQTTVERVHIYSGSQQDVHLVAKALLNRGDRIVVLPETYLAALQVFDEFDPEYMIIGKDHEGPSVSDLKTTLAQCKKEGKLPKLLYLVPNFNNPTGETITLTRRKEIADVIKAFGVPLLEDDPYRALRYRGRDVPPIHSFAPDHVIYCTTLSKTFAPAVRIGIMTAPSELLKKTAQLKQGMDINTSKFLQALAAIYIKDGYMERHVPKIRAVYAPRYEAMLHGLSLYFKQARWTTPDGGMFVWVTLPNTIDTEELLPKALKHGVAFVPGISFYPVPTKSSALRLNFTNQPPEKIHEGLKRLASLL